MSDNSNNSNYNNGISNYRGIQSFGTPSAFDPSRISRANSLNKQTSGSPFRLIDVNVSLVDSKTNDIFVLSEPLPVGSVIQVVSMHGHNSLLAGTILNVLLYQPPNTTPSAFPNTALTVTPALFTAAGGLSINPGITNAPGTVISYSPSVGTTPIVSLPTYPCLLVSTLATDEKGSVNVKLVIFSP